jgi:hypothetical protein
MRSVHARRDEGGSCIIKLKRAKIDTKSVPAWIRSYRSLPIVPVNVRTHYLSRLLTCTSCGHHKETAHMQLRMTTGLRGICCPKCHRQARAIKNLCQCGVVWHQCGVHQHDPAVHRSEKPAKDSKACKPIKAKGQLSLYRTAPEALTKKPAKRRRLDAHGSGQRLHTHLQGDGCATVVAPRLNIGMQPRLAARFPHLATPRG